MTTLIVPCAGKSSRFKNMRPKYLLTYPDGEIMVKKSISGLNLNHFDRIIITIVQEHCDKYEADLILRQAFKIEGGSKIELCILPFFTSCQSETIYETIVRMRVQGDFVIKDSDNYIQLDEAPFGNFIVGLNIDAFDREIFRLNSKSFLIVNDQNVVTDIIEKKIKSDCICVGMYGFEDAELFSDCFKTLLSNFDYSKSKEIYISHVISFMIGVRSAIFMHASASNFEDWGTIQDWQIVQQKQQTYFVDLDGVVFQNRGKYGSKTWQNDNCPIEENISSLKKLYDEGAQIVITTSRGKEFESDIRAFFESRGITLHAIVTECNHARRVIINDFAPSNAYPSCVAVSIPRNGSLKDYM